MKHTLVPAGITLGLGLLVLPAQAAPVGGAVTAHGSMVLVGYFTAECYGTTYQQVPWSLSLDAFDGLSPAFHHNAVRNWADYDVSGSTAIDGVFDVQDGTGTVQVSDSAEFDDVSVTLRAGGTTVALQFFAGNAVTGDLRDGTADFDWSAVDSVLISATFGPGDGCLGEATSFTIEPDTDGDGVCDASDVVDRDDDGVPDDCDAFPDDADESADSDGDGVGDNGDACPDDPGASVRSSWYADRDGDGFGDPDDSLSDCSRPDGYVADASDCDDDQASVSPDAAEVCDGVDDDCDGAVPASELDGDGDGLATCAGDCDDRDASVGDSRTWYADVDMDGLGDPDAPIIAGCAALDGAVSDRSDLCPEDPENDADGDGICEVDDNCDMTANADQSDLDGDGEGDLCDSDIDGDGVENGADNCAYDANVDQRDLDGDGAGDVCDDDIDGDGVLDAEDACLDGSVDGAVDASGCSIAQLCPCDNAWKNHGAYVSCVAHASNAFVAAGAITAAEKEEIQSNAGASSCGRKGH